MKAVWVVLGALGCIGGAAFLVFWALAWTGHVPPGQPLAVSLGVMLLAAGLFALRGAARPAADRGTWKGSNVRIGRVSALGFGVAFGAIGAAFLGSRWLPGSFGLGTAAVAAAGFALIGLGQARDARRAGAGSAPGRPDHRGPEPGPAPGRAGGE